MQFPQSNPQPGGPLLHVLPTLFPSALCISTTATDFREKWQEIVDFLKNLAPATEASRKPSWLSKASQLMNHNTEVVFGTESSLRFLLVFVSQNAHFHTSSDWRRRSYNIRLEMQCFEETSWADSNAAYLTRHSRWLQTWSKGHPHQRGGSSYWVHFLQALQTACWEKPTANTIFTQF